MPCPAIAERASILLDRRCRSCGATLWYADGEWKCVMCGRPVRTAPPIGTGAAAPSAGDETSSLASFLQARCVRSTDGAVATGELYAAYRSWCLERGQQPLGRTAFARRLREQGFDRHRTRRARIWRGLAWAG